MIRSAVNATAGDTPELADVAAQVHSAHWLRPTTNHADAEAWLSMIAAAHRVSIWRLFYVTVAKRILDITAATFLIVVLSPLLVAALVVVRLDSPGAPIFRQPRVGRGGHPFTLYKFRTMRHEPATALTWFRDDDGNVHHKIRNDPRVTRIGRWLRRTSIDELPQLINIIKGDMSLIGPRPELPEIVAQYEPWQHDRHLVRPGITGWWQVSGRGDLPMDKNTELDLFYVRGQSFSLDWKIALKTIRVVLRGSGAY